MFDFTLPHENYLRLILSFGLIIYCFDVLLFNLLSLLLKKDMPLKRLFWRKIFLSTLLLHVCAYLLVVQHFPYIDLLLTNIVENFNNGNNIFDLETYSYREIFLISVFSFFVFSGIIYMLALTFFVIDYIGTAFFLPLSAFLFLFKTESKE